MTKRSLSVYIPVLASMVALACQPDGPLVEPAFRGSQTSLLAARDGVAAIVVNPNVNGEAIASTIQEGIDRVASGGQVLVKPGIYNEALSITKGLTLRSIGDGGEQVVIQPHGAPDIAIQVATPEPVVIQDLTLVFGGAHGIRGDGVVNVTVQRITASAVGSAIVQGRVMAFFNDSVKSGGRTHVTLRDNVVDGGVSFKSAPSPAFSQMFGISLQGDVDGSVERNAIRHTGGASIVVTTRPDLGGNTNVDILDNDMDEAYPLQRAGILLVQALGGVTGPLTATGTVNIIGNTIRNSLGSPLPITGISQMYAPGRIERNRIIGVVQKGVFGIATRNPAAIWIGNLSPTVSTPSINPVIRFNDIEQNEQAGLRIGPNITSVIDATCNWWGASNGPSGLGSGSGNALLTEGGVPTPAFSPFAIAPIAGSALTQCE
ncbi:MAG TPA: hypothetical protein VJN70_10155 [Gemmatimonadaceae bacterium]|nr:hypothetical protein [Gemmatimonadaceae bacterium]